MITISTNISLGRYNNKRYTLIKKGRSPLFLLELINSISSIINISIGTIEYALKKRMMLVSNVKSIYKHFQKGNLYENW